MKCIDADKLIAKLTKMQFDLNAAYLHPQSDNIVRAISLEYDDILSLVDSLQQEQPEVDLEKELEKWRHDHFKGKRDGDYNGEYLERESQLDLARHFYELRINARKK